MKKSLIQIIPRVKEWAKSHRTALLISLCNVFILTLVSYFLNNQPLFTGENLNRYAWLEWAKDKLGLTNQTEEHDSVLYVNTSYDNQLTNKVIDSADEDKNNKISLGNIVVADRSKLLKFLHFLRTVGGYKYVFLDVRFEKGTEVPDVDSALFAEIFKMKKIVIANHSDIEIADSSLLEKAALVDYKSTIVETNFVRWKYSYSGNPTMPLYAYKELTGKDINSHFLFYTCNGRLCYNSLFLKFPIEDNLPFNSQGEPSYNNLGSDLLNLSEEELATVIKDMYIVIGNMTEDMHDTYSGLKPGSKIMYAAFRALMAGEHFVSYRKALLFALLYFLISFFMFDRQSFFERFSFVRKSHSKLLYFVLSLVEYTFLLSFVAILLYLCYEMTVSIMLPSIYFAIQKNIIHYKRLKI